MPFPVRLHPRCNPCRQAMLAVVLLLVAISAWPASPRMVSFADAQRLAVERAPTLKARQSQTDAARQDALRADALPDPRLAFGLANVPVTGRNALDLRAEDMTMKQVGVMQDFPARAKREARRAMAERKVEQARAFDRAGRLSVRQAVAQSWIALWAAQRELEALRLQRAQSALAIRIAKARLAGGTGTVVDAMATQATALDLDNRIDAAASARDAARSSLARWLGTAPEDLAIAGAPPDLSVLPVNEATLLASVDRQGPMLQWHSRESLAQASVDAAIADKHPDWSVAATYGQRSRAPDGMPRSDMVMIEFSVGLPLFARNRQDRDIAARRSELDAVSAEHEDARRAQVELVQRALAEWNGMKRQVARMDIDALPLAHDRTRTALAAYGGGGPLQPWLDARRDELELHAAHARHQADLGRAWASLAYLLPEKEAQP